VASDPVILATWKAEIRRGREMRRRIVVGSQPWQIVHKTPSPK
jgi:hypothetical protein